MALTPEEDAIYSELLAYYRMGDVATEDVEAYIVDAIRMKGTFEGTSKFANRIKELVDSAEDLPDVDGERAIERISEKIAVVAPTLPPKPTLQQVQKGIKTRGERIKFKETTKSLLGKLPLAVATKVAAMGLEKGGNRKTRKSTRRQTKKTRKYSRRR